ncbi:MAG: recombination protein RecR [Deltaproteobacteria bacterium]|nr:recombination protein RecR [Deltaproteobacteria bacterium]
MEPYPKPVIRLIDLLGKLPGIGKKSAARMAFYLLHAPDSYSDALAEAIHAVKKELKLCARCFNLADAELCAICRNPKRDPHVICVVEDTKDLIAIEQTGAFQGLYHVLHGQLDPLQGVGPEKLKIEELVLRLRDEPVKEVILATNPDANGTATALYLQRRLKPFDVKITRLAQGIPVGGDIEYVDTQTLGASLKQRTEF